MLLTAYPRMVERRELDTRCGSSDKEAYMLASELNGY